LSQNEYALIVAGGKGTRMNTPVPKQFLELAGRPVILHTIDAFIKYSKQIKIIVVLPENDFSLWKELTVKHHFDFPVVLQTGGETRFESVKRGLDKIDGDGLVAIHDGVRPLVSKQIIAQSFKIAAQHGSAVASVPLKESLRRLEDGQSETVDRSKFRIVQTPQTFNIELIKTAYRDINDTSLTDDASVAEKAGHTINLFEGSYENIKITTAEDLLVAASLLKQQL
jgi:2-C-methyl-D-erythritol 4-phosphate cytidylyltransferase